MNAIRENLTKTKFPNTIILKKTNCISKLVFFFIPLLPKIQLNSHNKSIYDYQIQNINPKNREEKKAVQMKIVTTKENTYTFEYSFVGDSKKQRGTVTKTN